MLKLSHGFTEYSFGDYSGCYDANRDLVGQEFSKTEQAKRQAQKT
jgi:hypothetical protein